MRHWHGARGWGLLERRARGPDDRAGGVYLLKGRLGPDDGALLLQALEAARELVRGDLSAERSDALGKLAESWLAHGPGELAGGERHQVIVHVDAATLADPRTSAPVHALCA